MARKKKVVAGTFSDTTYYFNDKGEIVDDSGQAAPPVFAKAIIASGINIPTTEEPKPAPKKKASRRKAKPPLPSRTAQQQAPAAAPVTQAPAAAEAEMVPPVSQQQGLGTLNERVAKRGGFFGDALDSAADSEYNKKDAAVGRSALAGAAKKFIGRPLKSLAKGAGVAASALMSTDYVGLGALSPIAMSAYKGLFGGGGGGGIGKRPGTAVPMSSVGGDRVSAASLSILKEILANVKNVNESVSNLTENVKTVSTLLDKQGTDALDDRRALHQQNEQIIRLLEIIANQGTRGPGAGGKPAGGGMLDMLKGALAGILPSLLKMGKGAFSLAKAGIKGVVGGAKLLGRGALAGAGLAVEGVKGLFKGGEKAAVEGTEKAVEKGAAEVAAKSTEKLAAEEGAKLAAEEGGKVAAKEGAVVAEEAGKAGEKLAVKEGEKVESIAAQRLAMKGATTAEEGAVKAAGKTGLKEIVAKVIGPRVAKVVGKSLPVVGALTGLGFGIARVMEGDFKGAAAEVGSGVASMFPGPGTAASIATDVGLLARDVYKEAYGIFPEDDPKAGERIDAVRKEVSDYITGNQDQSGPETTTTAEPAAPPSEGGGRATLSAPSLGESTTGEISAPQMAAMPLMSGAAPILNSAAGFNAGSANMALQGQGGNAGTTIINNVNNSSAPTGKGATPERASGTPSTTPKQSQIDMILYGNLYGAGIP